MFVYVVLIFDFYNFILYNSIVYCRYGKFVNEVMLLK